MSDQLFNDAKYVVSQVKERSTLSRGRRRTIEQSERIEGGVHPLHGRPLLFSITYEERTCGECFYRHPQGRFWKCGRFSKSHSEATDCRAWWPACDLFLPKVLPFREDGVAIYDPIRRHSTS